LGRAETMRGVRGSFNDRGGKGKKEGDVRLITTRCEKLETKKALGNRRKGINHFADLAGCPISRGKGKKGKEGETPFYYGLGWR